MDDYLHLLKDQLAAKDKIFAVPDVSVDEVVAMEATPKQLHSLKNVAFALWNRSLHVEAPEGQEAPFRLYIAEILTHALSSVILSEIEATSLLSVWGGSGHAHATAGQHSTALKCFERAFTVAKSVLPLSGVAPPKVRSQAGPIFMQAALSALLTGDAAGAECFVSRGLEVSGIDPASPADSPALGVIAVALFNVAVAASQIPDRSALALQWTAAAERMGKVCGRDPLVAACLRLHGSILIDKDDPSAALDVLERSLALEDGHPVGSLLTLRAALKLAQFDTAKRLLFELCARSSVPVDVAVKAVSSIEEEKSFGEKGKTVTSALHKLLQAHPLDSAASYAVFRRLYGLLGCPEGAVTVSEKTGTTADINAALVFAQSIANWQRDGSGRIEDTACASGIVRLLYLEASERLDTQNLTDARSWIDCALSFEGSASHTELAAAFRLSSRIFLSANSIGSAVDNINSAVRLETENDKVVSLPSAFLLFEIAVALRDMEKVDDALTRLREASASLEHFVAAAQLAQAQAFTSAAASALSAVEAGPASPAVLEAQVAVAVAAGVSLSTLIRVAEASTEGLLSPPAGTARPPTSASPLDAGETAAEPEVDSITQSAAQAVADTLWNVALALSEAAAPSIFESQPAEKEENPADSYAASIQARSELDFMDSVIAAGKLFLCSSQLLSKYSDGTAARQAAMLSLAVFLEGARHGHKNSDLPDILSFFSAAHKAAQTPQPDTVEIMMALEGFAILAPSSLPASLGIDLSTADIAILSSAVCLLFEFGVASAVTLSTFLVQRDASEVAVLPFEARRLTAQAIRYRISHFLALDTQTAMSTVSLCTAWIENVRDWPLDDAHWLAAVSWNSALSARESGHPAEAKAWGALVLRLIDFTPEAFQKQRTQFESEMERF